MSDDPSKIILAETAISAMEESPRRRLLRRRKAVAGLPLTKCENCDAPLHGHWCAQCGQAAVEYRRSFRHVIVDILDSFLSWDSKVFASLAWLLGLLLLFPLCWWFGRFKQRQALTSLWRLL